MHPVGKIFVHCLLILSTILNVNSGERMLSTPTTKRSFTEVSDEVPAEFPKNATIIYNNTMCWPNISRTFWRSMMHVEKPIPGIRMASLRSKFDKLTENVTDNIMRIILTINELSTLLQNENILELSKLESVKEDSNTKVPVKVDSYRKVSNKEDPSMKPSVKEDSSMKTSVKEDTFTKTIVVPILLIIILLLLTYIAFQHRKLQFASTVSSEIPPRQYIDRKECTWGRIRSRYKDAQISIRDELIDP